MDQYRSNCLSPEKGKSPNKRQYKSQRIVDQSTLSPLQKSKSPEKRQYKSQCVVEQLTVPPLHVVTLPLLIAVIMFLLRHNVRVFSLT